MNIYHVTQNVVAGYDSFSDFVIAAPDEKTARESWPRADGFYGDTIVCVDGRFRYEAYYPFASELPEYMWPLDASLVKVRLIGTAAPDVEPGVICSSFHAG